MNILIIVPVVLLIVVQAFSVSAQYKWRHQHGYSDYQYVRYDLPRFELRLPDSFNNRIFEHHFAQTIHGFQPFQQREYVTELRLPNFQSPHDVYVEHHWPHPMLLPPIDPFRWSVQSTLSMSFKIKVPIISNNDDKRDGFVKERNPTSETETKPATDNTDIQSEAENKPETNNIKDGINKPETDIKHETDKPKSVQPGTDKPKIDTTKPEADIENETDKPNSVQPGTDKLNIDTTKPEADIKHETDKPKSVQPGTDKPKTDTTKPETDIKHETDKPNSVKPETDKPETDKLETDIELETNKPDADIKPVTNKLDAEIKPVADIEAKSIKPDTETEKATVNDITENESKTVGAAALETESPKETIKISDVESESTTPTENVTKSNNIDSTTDKVGSSTSTDDARS